MFFAMPILAMHIARTLNTGKERLRASNLLPVHLLGEEEVDHDHPASKYCEDGDEEAEDGLPDDPECLKLNMGVDAWSIFGFTREISNHQENCQIMLKIQFHVVVKYILEEASDWRP